MAGFASLTAPQQPIGDPWFSTLEILIIVAAPLMVALMVAVHAWASPEAKPFSLLALVFMSLAAGLTCGVHFVILTMSRQAALDGLPWLPLFLSRYPYCLPPLSSAAVASPRPSACCWPPAACWPLPD
jgi:hypothetical protein